MPYHSMSRKRFCQRLSSWGQNMMPFLPFCSASSDSFSPPAFFLPLLPCQFSEGHKGETYSRFVSVLSGTQSRLLTDWGWIRLTCQIKYVFPARCRPSLHGCLFISDIIYVSHHKKKVNIDTKATLPCDSSVNDCKYALFEVRFPYQGQKGFCTARGIMLPYRRNPLWSLHRS